MRDTSLPTGIPFSKTAMMDELRLILLVQATQILATGGPDAARAFVGFDLANSYLVVHAADEAMASKIDLSRFRVTQYFDIAYDYAFQTDAHWQFNDGIWHETAPLGGVMGGYDASGSQSPYDRPESRCRHVLDMTLGRKQLDEGHNVDIRQLSLLAGMKEAAVRTALSAEKIKTEGSPAGLPSEVALRWLERRRGFIPTRPVQEEHVLWAENFQRSNKPFAEALRTLFQSRQLVPTDVARSAKVELNIVEDLLQGPASLIDIGSLIRVAHTLGLDKPHFAGRAIEAGLRQVESS